MNGLETRDYRNHRLTDEEWEQIRKMRKDAMRKILHQPEAILDTIRVVVPEHYGSAGVIWESRYVTENQMEGLAVQYPNMQILDDRYKVMRKEAEEDG